MTPFFADEIKAFFEFRREFSCSFSGGIRRAGGIRMSPLERIETICFLRRRGDNSRRFLGCGNVLLLMWEHIE